ncbi:MAG: hypothetical protein ACQERD_12400 [Campylobacterota bacterium]
MAGCFRELIIKAYEKYNQFEVVLYQTGYLTIDKVTNQARGGLLYHLKVPNK